MRRKFLCAKNLVILIIISKFFAATSPAQVSSNFVSRPGGFVRFTISTNEQKLVSLPLKPLDCSINAVLFGQLKGSADERTADGILKWDTGTLEYIRAFKAGGTGDRDIDGKWFASFNPLVPSSLELEPGEGFFIWNRQTTTQDVFLSGEVVLDATNSTVLPPSFNLVGYPYSTAPENSELSRLLAGVQPDLAKGYWLNNTTDVSAVWLETRPYQDVFGPEGGVPAILGIEIKEGREALLAIECDGLPSGTKLDIYYKDLLPTDVFESEKGWLIADTDLQVNSQSVIEWTDTGNFSRKPVNEVFARYYLIGRSDIDLDRDGVPDSRESFVFGTALSDASRAVESALRADPASSSNLVSSSTNLTFSSNAAALRFPPAALPVRVIYVDRRIGSDSLTGRSPAVVVPDGPKKTIKAGVEAAGKGGMVVIGEGSYGESLHVAGRDVSVRFDGRVDLRGGKGNAVTTMPVEGISSNLVDGI